MAVIHFSVKLGYAQKIDPRKGRQPGCWPGAKSDHRQECRCSKEDSANENGLVVEREKLGYFNKPRRRIHQLLRQAGEDIRFERNGRLEHAGEDKYPEQGEVDGMCRFRQVRDNSLFEFVKVQHAKDIELHADDQ